MGPVRNVAAIAGRGWYGWLALAIAVVATLCTWAYGFWRGPTSGLIFLPLGTLVFVATIGALAMPMISIVLVIVAALTMINSGIAAAVLLALQVFLAVGLVSFGWVFWIRKWRRR